MKPSRDVTKRNEGSLFPKATILKLQKMSTEDGPGLRSTVFFKGCPLRCAWCHNPESISTRPEVHWVAQRCIGCLTCIKSCPEQALSAEDGGISVNRSLCTGCLECTKVCPSTAMEAYGRIVAVDEIVRDVMKDRVYYEKSGGGVTLSGGEPSLQPVFARALMRDLKQQGIHTALDTSGHCRWETLETLIPLADLVMYDIKLIAPEPHREHTGVTSTLILENLLKLASFMDSADKPPELWIRTPVIPGYTNDPANIRAIGTFIRETLGNRVSRWDLCAFNNLCSDKYAGLGMEWKCRDLSHVTEDEMERLAAVARKVIERPGIVFKTGPMVSEKSRVRLSLINGGIR